jgi:hypothetical protein
MSVKAPLGSAANPRGGANLGNTCRVCKSTELWSSYFTPDGNGGTGDEPGARYLTMCSDCGEFYDTSRRAR